MTRGAAEAECCGLSRVQELELMLVGISSFRVFGAVRLPFHRIHKHDADRGKQD